MENFMSTDPTTPPAAGSYEFNEGENKVFNRLARNARSVGFWSALYGGLILLTFVYNCIPQKPVDPIDLRAGGHLANLHLKINRIDWKDGNVHIDFGALITGVVFLLLGIWSRRAASGFQAVAKTRGGDIGHLMVALKSLSKLYGFLALLILIVVLIVTLLMLLVLVAFLLGAPNVPR
jgi:hypothetical protein